MNIYFCAKKFIFIDIHFHICTTNRDIKQKCVEHPLKIRFVMSPSSYSESTKFSAFKYSIDCIFYSARNKNTKKLFAKELGELSINF